MKRSAILWWLAGGIFLLIAAVIFCMVTGILERNIVGVFWGGLYPLLLFVIVVGMIMGWVKILRDK